MLRRRVLLSRVAEQLALYAQEKRLSVQTLARWRAWVEEEQTAFLAIAQELQLGENQLRDFLDWLEEIVRRDGGTVRSLLARPEILQPFEAKLARNDKLKAVKEGLRKIRYPHLSRLEEDLREAVRTLDLGRQVHISFPPTLEGDEITVAIKVRNVQELTESLSRLRRRLDDGMLQRIFDLLDQV
jgi:hypothetical protein